MLSRSRRARSSSRVAHLRTLPILLVPVPLISAPLASGVALILPAATVANAHTHRLRVHAPRVRQLELEPGVVVFEEVGGVIHVEELDEPDPPASLVVAQPHGLDVVGVEHLRVGRDTREAVEDVILGCVVGQALDDDGGGRPAGWVSAGGSRARVGTAITIAMVGRFVIVGEGAVVVWS